MSKYTLSDLPDRELMDGLTALARQDQATTAQLLAHIAEVDSRRLYLPAAYDSMHAYCVRALGFSDDAASKRIHAAHVARRVPGILPAIADGRLHLTAVITLGPKLTPENADELLSAAAHKTRAEIEVFLARRFPRPEALTLQAAGHAPERVSFAPTERAANQSASRAEALPDAADLDVRAERALPAVDPTPVRDGASLQGATSATPDSDDLASPCTAPALFPVRAHLTERGREDLRYAQELLSHQLPFGDVGKVFELALRALIPSLERRKFAATSTNRRGHDRPTSSARHIPAHVKRAVWKRDHGRCTYESESGTRCEARAALEFDHIQPVARGGASTVDNLRLRCRAHNQYEAERAFGVEFMRGKRERGTRRPGAAKPARGAAAGARIHGAADPRDG